MDRRDEHGDKRKRRDEGAVAGSERAPKRSRWGAALPADNTADAPSKKGTEAKRSKHSKHKSKHSNKHKSSKHSKHKSKHKSRHKDDKKKKKKKSSKKERDRNSMKEDALKALMEGGSSSSSSDDDEPAGSDTAKLEDWQISSADYFAKSTEFRVFLKLVRRKMFEDLTSKEAHKLFATKFVPAWNKRKLDKMYYDGIPAAVLDSVKRTGHKWSMRLGSREKFELDSLRDRIAVQTNRGGTQTASGSAVSVAAGSGGAAGRNKKRVVGPARPPPSFGPSDHRYKREQEREERRHDAKRYIARKKAVLEELVPKATGREAQLEKRRQKAARIHGAARDRESQADGLDLPESATFGDSGRAELNKQLAKHRARKARADNVKNARLEAARRKEEEKMHAFKVQMGLI